MIFRLLKRSRSDRRASRILAGFTRIGDETGDRDSVVRVGSAGPDACRNAFTASVSE